MSASGRQAEHASTRIFYFDYLFNERLPLYLAFIVCMSDGLAWTGGQVDNSMRNRQPMRNETHRTCVLSAVLRVVH